MTPLTTALTDWLTSLPDDALIDVRHVAVFYSCSPRHVWRAADARLIPQPLRIGRIVRWRIGTIRDHIRDGCQPCRTAGRA